MFYILTDVKDRALISRAIIPKYNDMLDFLHKIASREERAYPNRLVLKGMRYVLIDRDNETFDDIANMPEKIRKKTNVIKNTPDINWRNKDVQLNLYNYIVSGKYTCLILRNIDVQQEYLEWLNDHDVHVIILSDKNTKDHYLCEYTMKLIRVQTGYHHLQLYQYNNLITEAKITFYRGRWMYWFKSRDYKRRVMAHIRVKLLSGEYTSIDQLRSELVKYRIIGFKCTRYSLVRVVFHYTRYTKVNTLVKMQNFMKWCGRNRDAVVRYNEDDVRRAKDRLRIIDEELAEHAD